MNEAIALWSFVAAFYALLLWADDSNHFAVYVGSLLALLVLGGAVAVLMGLRASP
jgi:hypothetical protein